MNEDPWSTATCYVTKTVLQTGVTLCSAGCCLQVGRALKWFSLNRISRFMWIHSFQLSLQFHSPSKSMFQYDSIILYWEGKHLNHLCYTKFQVFMCFINAMKVLFFQLHSGCFYIVFSHFNLNAFFAQWCC